ncbi:hypothetical protein HDV63DRAFT_95998 [Trichoderma sp. SZMC 28014]
MFASACFASAAEKKKARGRESPPSPCDLLPQTTTQAKKTLPTVQPPSPASYKPLVSSFSSFASSSFSFAFAYDFLLGTVLAVISCVSLQPVSSNLGDNRISHALVGVFLRVLRPLSVLCDDWMLVRPLCVHDFGQETGVLIRQLPLLPLFPQQMS